jgi:signal transduction histidine kinase
VEGMVTRVLLIEDDEADFKLTQAALAKSETGSFALVWVRRFQEALSLVFQGGTDVILLDLTLPETQGWDGLEQLIARAYETPIVVITDSMDEKAGMEAVRRGAQDYVFKYGTDSNHLVRTIRHAIERKRTETALHLYRDHLEELVERRTTSLREAIAKLEAHDNARMQFVSNVSHELKTPLASMGFAIENLLGGVVGDVPEGIRGYLLMIREDCQRLRRTVEDILDLSRIDRQAPILKRSRLSVWRLCSLAVSGLGINARSKSLTLEAHDTGIRQFIQGDSVRMERVLANIINNAIKYTPKGGRIGVWAGEDPEMPGYAYIRVVDNGVGVPKEHLGRISERYYRVGEHIDGTGLGLAISREIVELHGGKIAFLSPPEGAEQGLEVRVWLPAADPATVLIVDDDTTICEVVRRTLTKEGFRVVVQSVAEDAIERIKAESADLVLMDLILPGMGGADLIARIRADPRLRRVAIIAITGGQIDIAKREILEGFSIPVILKPWANAELVNLVHDTLLGRETVPIGDAKAEAEPADAVPAAK